MPRTTGTGKKMTKQQRFNSVCKKCKFAFKKYVDPISRSWLSQWANWRLHGAKWQFARPFCAHYWIMSQIVWQHSGSFWQHRNWPCCVFSVWIVSWGTWLGKTMQYHITDEASQRFAEHSLFYEILIMFDDQSNVEVEGQDVIRGREQRPQITMSPQFTRRGSCIKNQITNAEKRLQFRIIFSVPFWEL